MLDNLWKPAKYDVREHRAIQTLAVYAQGAERPWPAGEEPPVPSPYDVKLAFDWIIHKAAQTYDDPFSPGQNDVSHYVMGRQSVGRQIIKLMKLKTSVHDNKEPV